MAVFGKYTATDGGRYYSTLGIVATTGVIVDFTTLNGGAYPADGRWTSDAGPANYVPAVSSGGVVVSDHGTLANRPQAAQLPDQRYFATDTLTDYWSDGSSWYVVAGGSAASGAGLPATIVSKTSAYTATAGDFIQCDTTSAGFTLTLPASPSTGALVTVKKTSSDVNTLTIVASGGGTIDGDANATTTTKGGGAVLEHIGSNNWRITAATLTTGPAGPTGPTGPSGPTGPTGQGVPTGGTTGQALVKNSATNYDTAWGTISGGSSALLAILQYTGSTSYSTASATLSKVDATNLTITFTAPASGNVIVDARAFIQGAAATTCNLGLISGASTTVADTAVLGTATVTVSPRWYITGLTSGTSYTYALAWRCSFGSGTVNMFSGAISGTSNSPITMAVWSA